MTAGSPAHLLTLAAVAAATALACAAARLRPGPWLTPFTRALAVLVFASEAAWWVYAAVHRLPWSIALPLHLCDVTPVVAAAALWWRRPMAAELAYFWGLGGSLVALLTPDLADPFPSFLFVQYVLAHAGAVVAAFLLPIGLGLTPRPGALGRTLAATAVLALVAGAADLVTGGNYMFLRHPPDAPTLLNLLGPWPWYIAAAALVVVAVIALLELPFRLGRKMSILAPAVRRNG